MEKSKWNEKIVFSIFFTSFFIFFFNSKCTQETKFLKNSIQSILKYSRDDMQLIEMKLFTMNQRLDVFGDAKGNSH